MKILLATLFLICFAAGAFAQSTNRITAKITVTTATSNNFAFTLNANTRTFTNDVTAAASQIHTNHTVAGSASNLYYHIVATPFSGPVIPLNYTNGSNVIFLRGALGQAMSVTILSNWATVEYSTQVFSSGLIDVRVPMASEASAVRIKVANELVTGINAYATNSFPTNSPALTNYVDTGNQTHRLVNDIVTNAVIQGGSISNSPLTNIARGNIGSLVITSATVHSLTGTNAFLTNSRAILTTNLQVVGGGYVSNVVGHSVTITNLSVPGASADTFQIGASALASNQYAMAIGNGAQATNTASIAIGRDSASAGEGSLAVGSSALALTNLAQAFGSGAEAWRYASVSLGAAAVADHERSVAIGYASLTTADDQIRLGDSTHHVSIPGEVRNVKQTNVWNTGTNRFDLAVAFSRTNITTLANGVNLVDPGLKTYLKVSGPSAGYSIDKLQRGWDGRRILIQKNDAFTLTIANESGSGGGTDADRILTGTGGNITVTNAPGFVELIYDSAASRWGVISKSN